VLKGSCDGRTPMTEPAVVEGAPPVPVELGSWVINVTGVTDTQPPAATKLYPADGAANAHIDAVVKVDFSEPVTGVDASSFTLSSGGVTVPAYVDQLSDGTWGLFVHDTVLAGNATYTATVAAPICDYNNNCTMTDIVWSFSTARDYAGGTGDSSWTLGFQGATGGNPAPYVMAIDPPDGTNNVAVTTNVIATFSEPVMNVSSTTFTLYAAGGNGRSCGTMGAAVSGTITSNGTGDVWTFNPDVDLSAGRTLYCVAINTGVQDLTGQPMAMTFMSEFKTVR